MFNRWRCKHIWHKTHEVDVHDFYGNLIRMDYFIYCPKCEKRKRIAPFMWPVLQNEQEIRNEYQVGADA